MKVNMLCSLCGFWEHTTELSLFCFEPWAKCDSAVTRASVLKAHNESKLAGIKRRCDKGGYVVLPLWILGTHNRDESVLPFGLCAKCDSAVTRVNVLKTHNESKLAEIKRCAMHACLPGVDGCGSPLSPVAVLSSAVVHSPCAECDPSVTRVSVLKTHNEFRFAKIRRCAVPACLPGVGRFWPCTVSWAG